MMNARQLIEDATRKSNPQFKIGDKVRGRYFPTLTWTIDSVEPDGTYGLKPTGRTPKVSTGPAYPDEIVKV